jgi:hypothetical protein
VRIFYCVVAVVLFGTMCGVTTGMAQEAARAREMRDSAEDTAAYARSQAFQAEKNLNACIQMYSDAQKQEDRCQRRLRICLQIPEFGR